MNSVMIPVGSLSPDPRLDRIPMQHEVSSYHKSRSKDGGRHKAHAKKADEEFASLVKDVAAHGIIYSLKVWNADGGQRLIADGRHRWLAAKEAGLTEVPCEIIAKEQALDIILSSENRRQLSKGALAYRAVLLCPEVATEAKKGNPQLYSQNTIGFNQSELASRLGVGRNLVAKACALYRLFEDHPELSEIYEKTVWSCKSIISLLGDMEYKVETFDRTGKYELTEESESKAEKEKRIAQENREAVKCGFEHIRTYGRRVTEKWEYIEDDDLDEIEGMFVEFLEDIPLQLKDLAKKHLTTL